MVACAVVPPARPPTFLGTGGLPLYPRRGLRPLHPAGGTEAVSFAHLRVGTLPNLPSATGAGIRGEGSWWPAPLSHLAHPPTFLETGGLAVPPAGAAPPAPCLGNGGQRFLTCASGRFLTCASGRFLACPTARPTSRCRAPCLGKRPQPSIGRQRRDRVLA